MNNIGYTKIDRIGRTWNFHWISDKVDIYTGRNLNKFPVHFVYFYHLDTGNLDY